MGDWIDDVSPLDVEAKHFGTLLRMSVSDFSGRQAACRLLVKLCGGAVRQGTAVVRLPENRGEAKTALTSRGTSLNAVTDVNNGAANANVEHFMVRCMQKPQ